MFEVLDDVVQVRAVQGQIGRSPSGRGAGGRRKLLQACDIAGLLGLPYTSLSIELHRPHFGRDCSLC